VLIVKRAMFKIIVTPGDKISKSIKNKSQNQKNKLNGLLFFGLRFSFIPSTGRQAIFQSTTMTTKITISFLLTYPHQFRENHE